MSSALDNLIEILNDAERLNAILDRTFTLVVEKARQQSPSAPISGETFRAQANAMLAKAVAPPRMAKGRSKRLQLDCLKRCRKGYREVCSLDNEEFIKNLLYHISATGTLLPPDFILPETEAGREISIDFRNSVTPFPGFASAKPCLSPEKQQFLFDHGISEDLFSRMDNVLLADYRIVKYFQESGGFGTITIVEDRNGNIVALKKIPLDNDKALNELQSILLAREVISDHSNIVRIYDIGADVEISAFHEKSGCIFYTMEAADDLNQLMFEGYDSYVPYTLAEAWNHRLETFDFTDRIYEIFLSVMDGLTHLHANGLIHRDIKLSNVGIFNGTAKLIDLGLVVRSGERNSVAGTPGFLPPELLNDLAPIQSEADDIYALARLGYQIFAAKSLEEYPAIPPLRDSSPALRAICKFMIKTCNVDRKKRFASLADFSQAWDKLIAPYCEDETDS